jgi:two-component system sensor histidine kinase/response regulator
MSQRSRSQIADIDVAPVDAPARAPSRVHGEREVGDELRRALADHLLAGRVTSDAGQSLLALLTTFVFWESTEPAVALTWLGTVLASALLRFVHRRKVLDAVEDPDARIRRLRVDVWISAALWGLGGPLLMGAGDVDHALLLLIYAGLIAAATSTVVADRPAFYGFCLLLLVPMMMALGLGELTRNQLSLLLLILLYSPFMLIVQARGHRILRGQIESQARLRISERVAASRTEFLSSLLEAAPNPIVILDAAHRIQSVNPAFERMTGYARAESLGRHLDEMIDTGAGITPLVRFLSAIETGEHAIVEVRVRRSDGSLVWVRLAGTSSSSAGVGAAILIGEDVTAQVAAREAQEAARVAAEQSARAKSMFLASMSHEIRTPMNGVMGMIELLLDTPLTDQQRDWADIIRSSADSLLTILNDILDVSKIEAGQLRLELIDFDLHEVVSETVRAFAHHVSRRGIELVLDMAGDIPHYVSGDPGRIRQVLSNLISNAVKFTERGEISVTVTVSSLEGRDVRLSLAVADTGIGIPADKREMIFEEFSQADASTTRLYGGTGLGLAICRRLVSMMRGTIRVDSEVGRGSVFTVDLTLPTAEAPPSARFVPAEPLAGHRLLVVDDNAAARRIVRELVEAEGGFLDEASAARAGIDMIRERAGTARAYDVVVLDSLMPELDGFAVAEAVSGMPEDRRPNVLMLTSVATSDEAERARSLGVRGLLEKPASRRRLRQAIGLLLAPKRDHGPERRMVTTRTLDHLPRNGRILLADDSKVNQHVAVAMLEKRGYTVDAVDNGVEAVTAALAQPYDVVLMDIEMPEMDGIAATAAIREQCSADELPIVALTAHVIPELERRCREAGMNDFLSKPFKADALYGVLERWKPQRSARPHAEPARGGPR